MQLLLPFKQKKREDKLWDYTTFSFFLFEFHLFISLPLFSINLFTDFFFFSWLNKEITRGFCSSEALNNTTEEQPKSVLKVAVKPAAMKCCYSTGF